MNQIIELIEALCPSGVPFKALEEVTHLRAGDRVTKSMMVTDGLFPVFGGGTTPTGFLNESNVRESVTIARAGSAGHVNFVSGDFWATDVCFAASKIFGGPDIKFVYYYLKSRQPDLIRKTYGGSMPKLDKNFLFRFPVPLPPLQVQEEIVQILDNFLALEVTLEAELEARKKQYGHYSRSLLTFPKLDGIRWVPMGDILRIKNGKDHKNLGDGDVPVWGSGGIMRYANESFYDKPSVLIPRKGSLGNLFYTDQPFWTVDTLFYTEINESRVLPKFIFRYLQTQDLAGMNEAGGVPSLTQTMLNKILIPLPELWEQQNIVDKLDSLDALTSNAESGLPAEIVARRKQYEHYRDRLLKFKEIAP